MKAYLSKRDRTPGPLFMYLSGQPLTKDALTSETRQLLSQSGFTSSQYAGHILGLVQLQPLHRWDFPHGLSKPWVVGLQIALSVILDVHNPLFLKFLTN